MKKYKNKILLALVALIAMSIYIFITTWQSTTYQEVRTMYPLEKSQNKQASEEFLKAMEYRIYIKELHPYFDYDSFIMAPLLEKLDYHFKKGKSLLPKDSIEDIVWWILFYKEIYGLLVPPRNDNSLAYENLPYQEFAKVHDEVYEMIMRYPDGNVGFKIDEIKSFRFKAMAILVGFYVDKNTRKYNANTQKEKAIKAAKDIKNYNALIQVLKQYNQSYKKFINYSKDIEFMKKEYFSHYVYIYSNIIMNYTFINNTQKLPIKICQSKNTKTIIKYSDNLINFVSYNNFTQSNWIYKSLFKQNDISFVPTVFKLLNYRCPNLKPEISELVLKIEELNKMK